MADRLGGDMRIERERPRHSLKATGHRQPSASPNEFELPSPDGRPTLLAPDKDHPAGRPDWLSAGSPRCQVLSAGAGRCTAPDLVPNSHDTQGAGSPPAAFGQTERNAHRQSALTARGRRGGYVEPEEAASAGGQRTERLFRLQCARKVSRVLVHYQADRITIPQDASDAAF